MSIGHFGTSAEVSQHFMKGPKCPTDISALVPNCLRPEVSWVRSVRTPQLGCLATPLRAVSRVTSIGDGGSLAEAIIRLLFGGVCDWAGPFLKFEKTVTWPPENRGSVSP